MELETILLYVVIALGISTILNIALKRVGISQIIGYIVTGTLMGYFLDIGHDDAHALDFIGEFGVVFLMFTIGLEISLAKLNQMKRIVFVNGALQVGLSSLLFFQIAHGGFGIDNATAVIVALSFSLSSTAVVLSHLKSSKEIHTTYGQRAMGILVFQDIAVIPILLLIGFMSDTNIDVVDIVTQTLISAIVLIGLLFVVGKRVMTWLLHFSAQSDVDELFMGSVLVIVIGASVLAHYAGFTYSLGAFVAGMIIAETRYHHKIEADIAPFKDLLLGTFFITVGLKIDIVFFLTHFFEIMAALLGVLILKSIIIYWVMKITVKPQNAMKTALTLSQVGEFSFAIFTLAFSARLIDARLMNLLVLVVVVSMMITPFLMTKIEGIVKRLFPENIHEYDIVNLKEHKDHIIVCGYSTVGKFVAEELRARGIEYIVIDNSLKHVKEGLARGEEIYYGDMSKNAILEALHAENASSVIITLDNSQKKRLIVEALSRYKNQINIIVKVVNLEERELLADLPVHTIVDSKRVVAKVLVSESISCAIDGEG